MESTLIDEISLNIKWTSHIFKISLPSCSTILDLKLQLQNETMVLYSRQKLMGLKVNGKQAQDDDLLADILLKPDSTILMIGTQESQLLNELETLVNDTIVNDLHVGDSVEVDPKDREENHRKIENRIKNVCKIRLLTFKYHINPSYYVLVSISL